MSAVSKLSTSSVCGELGLMQRVSVGVRVWGCGGVRVRVWG